MQMMQSFILILNKPEYRTFGSFNVAFTECDAKSHKTMSTSWSTLAILTLSQRKKQ